MSKAKKKVYLFVGNDITAHLIMNQVVQSIRAADVFRPVIVCTKDTNGPKERIPELLRFSFYEKTLLNNHLYPYINDNAFVGAKNLSPQQFKTLGVEVIEASNVNDPEFVAKINSRNGIAAAVSIRCTQIFRKPLVETISSHGGVFLNIHSGVLPHYRGVMPTARLVADKLEGKWTRNDYGCYLHHVDPFDPSAEHNNIDTGNIVGFGTKTFRTDTPLWELYADLAPLAADAIIHALDKIGKTDRTLLGTPQNNIQGRNYYSFPSADEVDRWKELGINFVDEKRAIRALVSAFSKASDPHGKGLARVLANACQAFNQSSIGNSSAVYGVALPMSPGGLALSVA